MEIELSYSKEAQFLLRNMQQQELEYTNEIRMLKEKTVYLE